SRSRNSADRSAQGFNFYDFLFSDQFACGVHLLPDIAHHYSAYPAVAEVVDNAGLVRFLPVREGLEAAVDFTDRFIAEVAKVGEKERQFLKCLVRPSHIPAGMLALANGVVPVFDSARS